MGILSLKSVLLTTLLLAMASFALLGYWFLPVTPPSPVLLNVESGTSLSRVARQLEHQGVVRSATAVKLLARLRGQSREIQSGNYRFTDPATPAEILRRLVSGDVEQVSLTVPEGFTLEQIGARLEEQGLADGKRFLQLCRDPQLIASFDIPAASLEGYLFPETYRFTPGLAESELIRMMVQQLFARLDDELLAAAEQRGLNRHQLLTLASIIEKETGQADEMPLIASVFHNRLERKIPLQTDPTVIYGIADFDGNLTRRHLTTATPYNTYLIRGLPPGPIASPGVAALHAAAHPAETSYLYFVSRGDGQHAFSATLQEHNRAVRRYQLKRRD
ncbi:MAG: endolytic transglycosylase MltG [Desulfuromonadales bacterium]|nr:endolytic transglycosylase MltG [Desulfuromonadales bacterium]